MNDNSRSPRFLRVLIETENGDKVNARIPMALVRAGFKLNTLLPTKVRETVAAQGLDLSGLSSLDPGECSEALTELSVDVCDEDGNVIKIFCE